MTRAEAIRMADLMVPNDLPQDMKEFWLDNLDRQARELMGRFGRESREELAIPEPWSNCYVNHIVGQIYYTRQEYGQSSNCLAAFDTDWKDWGAALRPERLRPPDPDAIFVR